MIVRLRIGKLKWNQKGIGVPVDGAIVRKVFVTTNLCKSS